MKEGIPPDRVHFVGNVMIDTLRANLGRAVKPAQGLMAAGVATDRAASIAADIRGYQVLTLHRPSNVDDPGILGGLLEAVRMIAGRCPVVFALHPRTQARVEAHGLSELLQDPDLITVPPLGYHAMLGLMSQARAVLTDSGGIQEETTALGVPCFTLREETERPITVTEGTNTLVGTDPAALLSAFDDFMATGGKRGRIPELWDGRAAERIAAVLRGVFAPTA